MKSHKNLWEKITAFENLNGAAHEAQRGKCHKPEVGAFLYGLEGQLWKLKEELESGAYSPGPYRTFLVREPKERWVSAAPFRDRVVHHALCRVIEPLFDRRMIYDSYANRKGKGTHAALKRFVQFARRSRYALKCDIQKYFGSIDHRLLLEKLARTVACARTMDLIEKIVRSSPPSSAPPTYFPGDDLFTPIERAKGLPIGNLTSQLFANVYLDGLDHFLKEQLRVGDYVRYVDDFAVFANDKAALRETKARIARHLESDRLRLHPGKSRVYRCCDGVEFLGFRCVGNRIRIRREAVRRFRHRMRDYQWGYRHGRIEIGKIRQSVASWLGHARQGDTRTLVRLLLKDIRFTRDGAGDGSAVAGRLVEQQLG